MSKNYIRVYCNGVKIRSTGSEKFYRDCVLLDLGIPIPKLLLDERFNGNQSHILDNLIQEMKSQAITNIFEDYIFTVEYVRKTNNVKKVIGYFFVPYFLKDVGSDNNFNYILVNTPVKLSEPYASKTYEFPGWVFGHKIIENNEWLKNEIFHIPLYRDDPSGIRCHLGGEFL